MFVVELGIVFSNPLIAEHNRNDGVQLVVAIVVSDRRERRKKNIRILGGPLAFYLYLFITLASFPVQSNSRFLMLSICVQFSLNTLLLLFVCSIYLFASWFSILVLCN